MIVILTQGLKKNVNSTCLNKVAMQGCMALIMTGRNESKVVC